jgi:RNA polymerase sigma factor (TIGR02999 family)
MLIRIGVEPDYNRQLSAFRIPAGANRVKERSGNVVAETNLGDAHAVFGQTQAVHWCKISRQSPATPHSEAGLVGCAMAISAGEVTLLLTELKGGDQDALAQIVPIVYRELRRLAARHLRDERIGHTLQPTALVHEVYLLLARQSRADWQNRAHLLAVSSQIMRRILVNYALQRRARKRTPPAGFALERLNQSGGDVDFEEILAIEVALQRLSELDARQVRVVELRYFGGLTVEEIAEAMGMSSRTVRREWASAKLWLRAELSGNAHDP